MSQEPSSVDTSAAPNAEEHRAGAFPLRLKVLLVAHLVVGMAPAAMFAVLIDTRFLPLHWALASIGLGQLVLLMLWVGMGTAGLWGRVLGSVAGSAYLAVWPVVGQMLVHARDPLFPPPALYVIFALAYWSAALVLGGAFLLVCRLADVRLVRGRQEQESSQYTIRQLLVLVTLAAIVLAATRFSNSGASDPAEMATVVGLFVLSAEAAWAALSPGRVEWRIIVVMLTAVALGIVQTRGTPSATSPQWHWQAYAFHPMILTLPTLIVIVTLLVVRSCGYRLVRKTVQPSAATRLST